MKKVYVVELQSPYDGGGTIGVFSNEKNAREFIESQKDFIKWDPDDVKSTYAEGDDFYYLYDEFDIDEV